jgi:hypothetical protein
MADNQIGKTRQKLELSGKYSTPTSAAETVREHITTEHRHGIERHKVK